MNMYLLKTYINPAISKEEAHFLEKRKIPYSHCKATEVPCKFVWACHIYQEGKISMFDWNFARSQPGLQEVNVKAVIDSQHLLSAK